MIKLRSLLSELDEPNTEPIHVLGKGQRSPEEREKNWLIAINRQIANYIKDGCEGDLRLSRTPIRKLPKDLKKVGGSLWLDNSKIEELPDGLHVGGWLSLYNTPIKKLPNGLYVKMALLIGYTEIEALPNDLHVGSGLDVNNTPLAKKYTVKQIRAMAPNVHGLIDKY